MGTVIYNENGVHIKRFYAGELHETLYQFNIGTNYAQMSAEAFVKMCLELGFKELAFQTNAKSVKIVLTDKKKL